MALITLCIVFGTMSLVMGAPRFHCSGKNMSTFPDLNLQELRGEYFSYYKSNTFPNISPRLNDAVQKYVIPQNKASNKFLALVSGTNVNPGGGCLQGLAQGYQIKDNRPCFAIKFVEPVTCQEEEWLHLKLSNDKLVLYHCFKLNVDGSCGHKVIRGMSTKKFLSPADKQAFMDAFARFGEPLPEIADPVNNACEKIKREAHNFIEADRRFGDNANYYQY